MSPLYQTEKEIRDEWTKRHKSPDTRGGGNQWYTDRGRDGITRDENNDIQRKGWAWLLQHHETPGFAEKSADYNDALTNSKAIKQTIGGIPEDLIEEAAGTRTITVDNVAGIARRANKIDRETPTPIQAAGIEDVKAGRAAQTKAQIDANTINQGTLALSKQTAADNMTLATNQMELARLDNKFDRENASADRNLTLQIAQMDSQLADKRLAYDRETRSMDKRDRMIATLMSGIGQLGGAFAL